MEQLIELWHGTNLYQISAKQLVMILVSLILLYLAISKKFEPLLLVLIGFGGLMANIPSVDIAVGNGILAQF